MRRARLQGGRPGLRAAAGFSLIEIVAAFAILALGMGLCMEIATSAMRQSRQAAEYTQAALNAKSLLDTVGIAERLEEGGASGEFDERYRWELSVIPYESEVGMESGLDSTATGVELYRLELLVTWQAGRGQREARFATLRALSPDVNRTGGF
jgi:general secretion pathway protein I